MKTKPPKTVESAKLMTINTDADRPAYDPLLYTKQYTNGHKFFLASEAKAMTELLNTEQHCRENFTILKSSMVRPRNPLNGDHTPRDAKGEIVLNPNAHGKVKGGIPLFSNKPTVGYDSEEIASRFVRKGTVGKIGVNHSRYDILGNKNAFGGSTPGQPEDLYKLTRLKDEEKQAQQQERLKINEFTVKEKAKRQQKELAKQLTVLRQQSEAKERELQYLQSTFTEST